MTRHVYDHFDGHDVVQLRNVLQHVEATDPTGAALVEGKLLWQSTDKRFKGHDGTSLKTVAWLDDFSAIGRYRGTWDASAGIPTAAGSTILPGEAIAPGDYWRVSTTGTIAGIGAGAPQLDPGDVIYAEAAAAAAPAQFFGLQANVAGQELLHRQQQTVALAANTPLPVTPNPAGTVTSVQTFDAAGAEIHLGVTRALDGSTVTLESLLALTGVVVVMSVDPA